jgi:hypothetical protein
MMGLNMGLVEEKGVEARCWEREGSRWVDVTAWACEDVPLNSTLFGLLETLLVYPKVSIKYRGL